MSWHYHFRLWADLLRHLDILAPGSMVLQKKSELCNHSWRNGLKWFLAAIADIIEAARIDVN